MNLFFHQAALGDFVLTFPILRGLPEQTVLIAPWSRGQLAGAVCDRVRAMDVELWEFSRLYAQGGPTALSPAIAELFEQADNIISFISDGTDNWAVNVARLAPQAQLFFVPPRPDDNWPDHICHWHSHELKRQGLDIEPVRIPRRGRAGGPIVVHPGSGSMHKCWAVERFEALIAALRNSGLDVHPVLGEVEIEQWSSKLLGHWQYDLGATPSKTLDQLYQVLVSARAFVGNDSGPSHLAAQLGLSTIVLFGTTDPRRWAPMGPAVTVLSPPIPRSMDWLDLSVVLAACQQLD